MVGLGHQEGEEGRGARARGRALQCWQEGEQFVRCAHPQGEFGWEGCCWVWAGREEAEDKAPGPHSVAGCDVRLPRQHAKATRAWVAR